MATLHARSAKWLNLAPAGEGWPGSGDHGEISGNRGHQTSDIRHRVRIHSSKMLGSGVNVGECGIDRVHTMESLGVMLNYHK